MPPNSDPPDLPLSHGRERGSGGEGSPVVVTATLPANVALHARPAAALVRAAGRFQATVTLSANGKQANAKSILAILALGATGGTEVTISATGEGAAEAARALADLIANLGA